ncbi:TetR family transcriptional regulator [Micromonospora fluostatini]|uniref:TetR family transcriptional regulator n=1 Tax=Micromonospora sp. JCM 30529 TaxID=3421643 RepID=UPI003D172A35
MATRRGRGGRERIIAAATTLFETYGINAVGMERLAAQAPVSKRTLYAHFPTKEQLVVAYLDHLVHGGQTVESALDRTDLSPRERILELFTVPGTGTAPIRGCPFVDAAVEFPDPDSTVHAFARHQKLRVGERITQLLRDLGVEDPEELGEQLSILADGAASRAMVLNDASCVVRARAAAETLLDAALPR